MYLGLFESRKDVMEEFEVSETELEGVHILFACYTDEDYQGDSFVLVRKEGKLYEVNGGHCSCYGLEGQWGLEEVDIEDLIKRVKTAEYYYCYARYKDELLLILSREKEG